MYSALTYDVMKSYPTRMWDKKDRNDYITLETRLVMWLKKSLQRDFLIEQHIYELNPQKMGLNALARGRSFDSRLGHYSFRGFMTMIIIATGFLPLSPVSTVSIMVLWGSSQLLGKKTQEKKHSNKNTEKKHRKKTQSICKKYLSTYNKSNMASI